MTVRSPSLNTVPPEVLEQIAYHTATSDVLGPPSSLLPLICLNRHIHAQISITSNCSLYARIFADKFDTAAALRRLGPEKITAPVLALELQRRCICLKRLRDQVDARLNEESDDRTLRGLLFHAYLMMLENDGKNERQLREYGRIESWLHAYWFDESGSSRLCSHIRWERWPPNDTKLALSMWLLWFFMKPEGHADIPSLMNVLRIFALSAHQYNLSLYPWTEFLPNASRLKPSTVIHYSEERQIEPAPLAIPAILSFLTLVNRMAEDNPFPAALLPSTYLPMKNNSTEWDYEWGRSLSVRKHEMDGLRPSPFKPGSIEGVWEGFFTYTEFAAYAALLAGASPTILHKCMVVRHRQTWKLREHHLIYDDASSVAGTGPDQNTETTMQPLTPGDPLRSHFPIGCKIREHRDGAHVEEPSVRRTLNYRRACSSTGKRDRLASIADIVIIGEGHSAWGQFNLVGRVRPWDGFISLTKEYVRHHRVTVLLSYQPGELEQVDGDRGKWLYRGYLVGDINGLLVGRWRDTLSPAEVPGYEGCFVMSRRR